MTRINKHIAWDYEETTNPYYQIYPISDVGVALLDDESICIHMPKTQLNDNFIDRLIVNLSEIIEANDFRRNNET